MFTLLVPAVLSIDSWSEQPVPYFDAFAAGTSGCPQLMHATSEQSFGGVLHHADPGIKGKAVAASVWSHPFDSSPSTFTGQTIFSGQIHRRTGTLTLSTHGRYTPTASGGLLNLTWEVLGSSGELTGVKGDGGFETFVFASDEAERRIEEGGSSAPATGVRWAAVEHGRKLLRQVEVSLELRFPGH